MFSRNYRLGSLFGIPIEIHPSWLVLLGITTWLLAAEIYPDALRHQATTTYAAMAVTSAWLFFASIVLHELGHSLVARGYGIPVRAITFFLFGGVSQITREPSKPAREFVMAVAGPGVSVLLGLLCAAIWQATGGNTDHPFEIILLWLAYMNGLLAVFNMIPAFPLDGGRVFRSILWGITGNFQRATSIAAWGGRLFAWTLAGAGILAVLGRDLPIADDPASGAWLIFMGLFLENAARRGLLQNTVMATLDQYRAGDLMTADPPVVSTSTSVGVLARGVLDLNPRVCYFVEDAGKLAGILSAYQMRAVPEQAWDSTSAGEAMLPRIRLRAAAPEVRASEMLMEMETGDLTHMPVVSEGRVIGVVARERILGLLRQAGVLS